MLVTTLRRFFSQQKSVSIKLNPDSQLSKYIRRNKSPAEVAWSHKMKTEWALIAIVAGFSLNFLYNFFPDYWVTRNPFMPTPESISLDAKKEAEAEYAALQNKRDK
jgi:hypothetical protein